MNQNSFLRLGGIRDVETFRNYLRDLQVSIPCDSELLAGDTSPLGRPLHGGASRWETGLQYNRWKDGTERPMVAQRN